MKRSSWIDKFLQTEKMTKLAKVVEAGYIEELRLLKDQVTASHRWSSIEDALEDFAKRNGFSRREMKYLQKEAGLTAPTKGTDPNALMEEGIGSQGAEFMANSKKHKDTSGGPFIVKDEKAADKIRLKEKQLHDAFAPDETSQTNEMKSLDAQWDLFVKKYAQEYGKILDLPGEVGSEEGMERLVKELAPSETKTTYNLVRHGFKFTNIHGEGFTKKDEPVKVTIYKYSFLKTNIANAINQVLRQQLAQELPIEEWITFLTTKAGPQARDLKMQLQKLQRDLFSDKPAYVETQLDRAKPQSINGILQHFPKSYQRVILKMLAEGEYRHLTGEAGRKHSEIFSSGHALGSFVLMESFDPYVKVVPQLKSKEDKQALVTALREQGRDAYSSEEFIALLDRAGISHQEMPINKEYQTLRTGDKEIRIENNANPSYRPVTNTLTPEELNDPEAVEEQLKAFQDRLGSVIMQDADRIEKAQAEGRPVPNLTPLAYERQPDGTYVPVDLKTIGSRDLTKSKLTYDDPAGEKTYLDNPTAGMHPSYKGSLEGLQTQEPFFSTKNPNRWKSKVDRPTTPKKEEPTPQDLEKGKDRWEKYKSKADSLKKFQALTWAMIRLGAADLWIDDKGRIYPNQDEMEKALYEECVEQAKDDTIEAATDSLSSFVEQLPKESAKVVPIKTTTPEEEEFEQLPLAAKSIERLKKIADRSEKLQKLLKG